MQKQLYIHRLNPEAMLLPADATTWVEHAHPLETRGVDGGFLYNFVHSVQELQNRAIRDRELSFWRDEVPRPDYPLSFFDDLNSRSFVKALVVPWTAQCATALLARVPEEHRGPPTTFLSYSWDSELLAHGYGVIYAAADFLNDGEPVWMDVFCHNQHDVGSVADQMGRVIARTDRVVLPMSEPPWYSRAWCVWEVLCAAEHGKDIHFIEYAKKDRDFGKIHASFLRDFRSIADAEATYTQDKELILDLAAQLFGSIGSADAHLRELMYAPLRSPQAR